MLFALLLDHRPRQHNHGGGRSVHSYPLFTAKKLLKEDWNPEQISHWLCSEESINISHEWIYCFVLQDKQAGGELYTNLRCKKQRNERIGSLDQ